MDDLRVVYVKVRVSRNECCHRHRCPDARVVATAWHSEHRAFVVEEYIHNGGSVITTQRAFRIRFQHGRHDPVPDRKTVHVRVEATGSAIKRNRQANLGP
ncbi:DUF4817 domain-containing protein [Trichonephila clavipes]|nr:DUF4817 domain-containing protein [Trichonephila clavipes]